MLIIKQLQSYKVPSKEISTETEKDPVQVLVNPYTIYDISITVNETIKLYERPKDHLSSFNNCIRCRNSVVIPDAHEHEVLEELHINHPGILVMKGTAQLFVWYPMIDKEINDFVKTCSTCAVCKA